MQKSSWLIALLSLATFGLGACSSTGESTRKPPPPYASPVGTDRWEVSCGSNKYILDRDAVADFYKEDGSQKSLMEFCNEQSGGSAIRKR